jgi:very-short-patch-repair endonuclease
VHWLSAGSRPRFGVAPLEATLTRATNDLPLSFAVAVLDSVLRATPLTPVELQFLAADWRPKARAAAALADQRSESGTESVLRVLLHEAGIHATPQAPLPIGDFARADLLVGDRLLIECDSEAHHAEPSNRRADLRRDESLMALGFIVLRPDYRHVFDDSAGVVATVAAIVARGDHLSARRGG